MMKDFNKECSIFPPEFKWQLLDSIYKYKLFNATFILRLNIYRAIFHE